MGVVTIVPAEFEPLTLETARAQCRIDGVDEDALLELGIAAARSKCESMCRLALISRTVEQTCADLPADGVLLDLAPVSEIVSVKYDTSDTLDLTLPSNQYVLDNSELRARLLPAHGVAWPGTRGAFNSLRVRYVAGFGLGPVHVPADIRHWLLLMVAWSYEHRAAFDATGKATAIPDRFVAGLLDDYRAYGF